MRRGEVGLYSGETPSWHWHNAVMSGETEPTAKERAQHELERGGGGCWGGLGDDVEAIELQPRRTALDYGRIDGVGVRDEIDHGGLAERIAVAVECAAIHVRVVDPRARMDIGELERGGDRRGVRRGYTVTRGWHLTEEKCERRN